MGRTMRRWMAAAGAVLVLGACENGATGAEDATGDVRFTFTGDSTGSFQAVGAITRENTRNGTYGAGALQSLGADRVLSVVGQRQGSRVGTVDVFLINLDRPAEGTVVCTAEAEECTFGFLYATAVSGDGENADAFFLSTEGTAAISSLTARRVRGSFTATVEDRVVGSEPRIIRVTGTFDVPLLSEWGR